MSTHERGNALIWWVIILMVLAVIGGLGSYYGYDNYQIQLKEVARLEAEIVDEKATTANRNVWLKELSDVVGWSATDVLPERPQTDLIRARISEWQDKFATVQSSDQTLEQVIDGIVSSNDAAAKLAADTKANFDNEVKARGDLQGQKDAIEAQKNQEISTVNASLAAERGRNTTLTGQMQATIDQLRDQVSDLETQVTDTATAAKKERIEMTNVIATKKAQMEQLTERLVRMEREPNRPDGAVIDASADLVWIDRGAKHGLKRGTRFNVFEYGKGKVKKWKGEIQIREVRQGEAVAAVVSTMDRLNPIVSGDMIANPYFDAEKSPEFVLLGLMPGRFGNDEMTRLLVNNGASVSSTVSANTDFLVVGEKAESVGGDDVPLEETEIFRMASLYGVEIITGRELEKILRF